MAELGALGECRECGMAVCAECGLSDLINLTFWKPKRELSLGEKHRVTCCVSSAWEKGCTAAYSDFFHRLCTIPSWNWWVIALIWIILPHKGWVIFGEQNLPGAPRWAALWLWGPQCLLGRLSWDLLCVSFCQANEANLLTKQSNKHPN